MLKKRSVPKLLIQNKTYGRLVRPILVTTRNFDQVFEVGDPVSQAKVYEAQLADELILLNIDSLPIAEDFALLDVIEYKRYRTCGSDRHVPLDVRIIFAANEDLDALMEQGAMTADFVDRLGLFKIRVPSLRERIEDIPGIVVAVLADLAVRHGWDERRTPRLTAGLFKRLAECAWLGNVRELRGFIELLVTEAGDSLVLSESLLVGELNLQRSRGAVRSGRPRRPTAKEVRRSIAEHDGNVTRAAKALGIGRTSLYRILGEDDPETPLDRAS